MINFDQRFCRFAFLVSLFLFVFPAHAETAVDDAVAEARPFSCEDTSNFQFKSGRGRHGEAVSSLQSIPESEYTGWVMRAGYTPDFGKVAHVEGWSRKSAAERESALRENFIREVLQDTLLLDDIQRDTVTVNGRRIHSFVGSFQGEVRTSVVFTRAHQKHFEMYMLASLSATDAGTLAARLDEVIRSCEGV